MKKTIMKKIKTYILLIIAGILLINTANAQVVNNDSISLSQSIIKSSFLMLNKLYEQNPNENIIFSPVSLHLAFGIIYSGAADKTATEISNILYYNKDINIFNQEYEKYFKTLKKFENDISMNFHLVNRIYYDKDFEIKKEYQKTVSRNSGENIFQEADFKNNYAKEEQKINNWVEKFTNKKIRNLIPKGSLDKNVKMSIVNALYFKSDWLVKFDKERTKEKTFFISKDKTVTKEFMTKMIKKDVKYFSTNNLQILELPYKTKNISLIIILPDESTINNINTFSPNEQEYNEICEKLYPKEIYVEIPKLKTESFFDLKFLLKSMGISTVFGNDADLSGIEYKRQLAVSNIFHKVFFETNEQGSEAAVATNGLLRVRSTNRIQNEFIANHPFIYILKENITNTPLIIGTFVK